MSSSPDVQLIYTDNPGDLPTQYPLTSDIGLQSIVARIDGSGAAGNFLPCINVYSQDGKLMARVPSDVTYAPGDTGVVTWSPFLARRSAGVTPAAGFTPDAAIAFAASTASAANNTLTAISFASVSIPTGSTTFQDFSPGSTPIKLLKNGWYICTLDFEWTGAAFADVRYYEIHSTVAADNLGGTNATPFFTDSGVFLSGTTFASGPVYWRGADFNIRVGANVWQNSGVLKGINNVLVTVLFLGPDLQPGRFPI